MWGGAFRDEDAQENKSCIEGFNYSVECTSNCTPLDSPQVDKLRLKYFNN